MKPGKIIILNGASSAGKTCLLHALQDILTEPYLEAGIDKFIWMLPRRYLDRPLWDDVMGKVVAAGPTGHHLVSAMHRTIATLADAGWNVLADHVLVEPAWLRDIVTCFYELPAYFIGVRCPLEVLENREKQRKNRTLGQARLQYHLVHIPGIYDLEVDTSRFTPDECAAQIQLLIGSGIPPAAFRQIKKQFQG
jgi:chloramphenicol 3-O phosphotransferase